MAIRQADFDKFHEMIPFEEFTSHKSDTHLKTLLLYCNHQLGYLKKCVSLWGFMT